MPKVFGIFGGNIVGVALKGYFHIVVVCHSVGIVFGNVAEYFLDVVGMQLRRCASSEVDGFKAFDRVRLLSEDVMPLCCCFLA